MFSLKGLIIAAGIIYYIYTSIKGNSDAQKNKKTTANPTPAQNTTLDEILGKLLEQQSQQSKPATPLAPIPVPKSISGNEAPRKLVFKDKIPSVLKEKKQGMPFEKRKLNDAREMPSRKQIERVIQREKKATEDPIIVVKDYDIDLLNHDKPHPTHHLSDKSNIKFHFKEDAAEIFEFDARQAIISQIILERKEY